MDARPTQAQVEKAKLLSDSIADLGHYRAYFRGLLNEWSRKRLRPAHSARIRELQIEDALKRLSVGQKRLSDILSGSDFLKQHNRVSTIRFLAADYGKEYFNNTRTNFYKTVIQDLSEAIDELNRGEDARLGQSLKPKSSVPVLTPSLASRILKSWRRMFLLVAYYFSAKVQLPHLKVLGAADKTDASSGGHPTKFFDLNAYNQFLQTRLALVIATTALIATGTALIAGQFPADLLPDGVVHAPVYVCAIFF